MNRKTISISILLCCCVASIAQAQQVWPGDVNNNGIVNGVDALYLGWAFGASGPARDEVDADWEAQPAPAPWAQVFDSGLNYFYADCDGDGLVDLEDLNEGVAGNYLETQGTLSGDGFANAAPGEGPRLRLVPSSTVVEPFSTVDIDLFLGEEERPVDAFYGIALQLSVGTRQGSEFDDFEFEVELGGWFDPEGTNSFTFFDGDDDLGQSDLAISRTDQQPVGQGFGRLGRFSVIMEDIIVGLEQDTFFVSIDSVFLVGDELLAVPVETDSCQIILVKDKTVANRTGPTRQQAQLRVYPNPARDFVLVQAPGPIARIELRQMQGVAVPLSVSAQSPERAKCYWPAGLPSGIYCLQVLTKTGGLHVQKIILH